jgi:hypothetical protein
METDFKPELELQHVRSRKRVKSESDDSERRKRVAERKKKRREEESPETKRQRLAKDAARKARQRAKETPEEKKARLERSKASRRVKRENETPEEHQLRLLKRRQSRRKSKVATTEVDTASSTETECPPQSNDFVQHFKFVYDFWYNIFKSMKTDVVEDETNFVNKSFVFTYHYWLDTLKRNGGFHDPTCSDASLLLQFSAYSCHFWYNYFLNITVQLALDSPNNLNI